MAKRKEMLWITLYYNALPTLPCNCNTHLLPARAVVMDHDPRTGA